MLTALTISVVFNLAFIGAALYVVLSPDSSWKPIADRYLSELRKQNGAVLRQRANLRLIEGPSGPSGPIALKKH
jgi:hypothetical protein